MIWNFLEGSIFGFLAHQVRHWVERIPYGYRELVAYTIGVLAAFVVVLRVYAQSDKTGLPRLAEAYFVGFAAVGSGVVAGWVCDTLIERVSE